MRIANKKVYFDSVSSWRTDGYSVVVTDNVGAVLVLPVDMLAELTDRVKADIEKRKKENEQLDLY